MDAEKLNTMGADRRHIRAVRALVLSVILSASIIYLLTTRSRELLHVRECLFERSYPYIPPLDRVFDFTVDYYGVKYEGNTGNYVDAYLLFVGAFEKPELYFLRDVLQAVHPNGAVFIDIGANTGLYSLFLFRYAREVHAVEPYLPVLRRLERMIQLNQINNIVVHPVGFGEQNAELPFHQPNAGNQGTGSFVDDWDVSSPGSLKLQIVRGDDHFAANKVDHVDVIKIDIEGYERQALKGLQQTLTKNRPIVLMELNSSPADSFHSKADLLAAFPEKYEFRVFSRSSDPYTGNYLLDDFEFSFDPTYSPNLVAYPAELRDKIPWRRM